MDSSNYNNASAMVNSLPSRRRREGDRSVGDFQSKSDWNFRYRGCEGFSPIRSFLHLK